MTMNPNILNKNPLMFFDRAVNAQRSQLRTVMADAVSECRTAADQAAELNETGQVLYVQRSGGNGHLCRAALHDVLPHAGRMV